MQCDECGIFATSERKSGSSKDASGLDEGGGDTDETVPQVVRFRAGRNCKQFSAPRTCHTRKHFACGSSSHCFVSFPMSFLLTPWT